MCIISKCYIRWLIPLLLAVVQENRFQSRFYMCKNLETCLNMLPCAYGFTATLLPLLTSLCCSFFVRSKACGGSVFSVGLQLRRMGQTAFLPNEDGACPSVSGLPRALWVSQGLMGHNLDSAFLFPRAAVSYHSLMLVTDPTKNL